MYVCTHTQVHDGIDLVKRANFINQDRVLRLLLSPNTKERVGLNLLLAYDYYSNTQASSQSKLVVMLILVAVVV